MDAGPGRDPADSIKWVPAVELKEGPNCSHAGKWLTAEIGSLGSLVRVPLKGRDRAGSLQQVGIARSVVAVEHRSGYVPRHRHRDTLRDASSQHVPGRGAPQGVEQPLGDPGSQAGSGPSVSGVGYWRALTTEHHCGDADVTGPSRAAGVARDDQSVLGSTELRLSLLLAGLKSMGIQCYPVLQTTRTRRQGQWSIRW